MIGLILAAAGLGKRYGSQQPKQFTNLEDGEPLYWRSLAPFLNICTHLVIVVPESWRSWVESDLSPRLQHRYCRVVAGGKERQDSVYKGLLHLQSQVRFVMVHDAARPFVSPQLIARVLEECKIHRACIPGVPVSETVKEVEGDLAVRTLDRDRLRLVQTPQAFEVDLLREAFENAMSEGFYGTDESALVERLGVRVRITPGDPQNIKITWEGDLPRRIRASL